MATNAPDNFENAARRTQSGPLRELWQFLGHNKKWWLLPLLVLMLFMGLLMTLSGSAAAPFIYTLF